MPTPLLSFFHPDRLWLLVLVPILLLTYWVLSRRAASRSRAYGIENLNRVLPRQASWKRHVAVVAAVLSLASLTVAFAQPKGSVNVPRERATVVLAVRRRTASMSIVPSHEALRWTSSRSASKTRIRRTCSR